METKSIKSRILVMSQKRLQTMSKEYKFVDSGEWNPNNQKIYLISITGQNSAPRDFGRFPDGSHALPLSFEDIGNGEHCITADDAKKIWQFAESAIQSDSLLLIHGDNGLSRSAAIAIALSEKYRDIDITFFEYENLTTSGNEIWSANHFLSDHRLQPNEYVLHCMRGAAYGDGENTEKKKDTNKNKKKSKLPKWLRAWIHLLIKMLVLCLIGVLVWNFVAQVHIIHDNNMYPHLKDGDLVVAFKLQEPVKSDAVLYLNKGHKMVGRLVAVAGDTVEINEEGLFMVNGLIPYENVFYDTKTDERSIEFPYEVPEGKVFILNDMREMTGDSRMYGGIDTDDVVGLIVFNIRHRGF